MTVGYGVPGCPGWIRRGPTWRKTLLMHAIARQRLPRAGGAPELVVPGQVQVQR